ncbi:hypothetical protein PR202_gb04512 [Eleusine coracana subsp. coracana]|uniref:Uncharacterized protein n=1 Tax=Eleusine coracana subsp. coracana TaxID=191504 RepID=A0AAV5E404_ELECO|nr:hypothetical protein PR202_gb04512 [Eleusine coracana subsp. coracana]
MLVSATAAHSPASAVCSRRPLLPTRPPAPFARVNRLPPLFHLSSASSRFIIGVVGFVAGVVRFMELEVLSVESNEREKESERE